MELEERTVDGLHQHLMETVLRSIQPGTRVVDLGAGSGALALRMTARGATVTSVGLDPEAFVVDLPFVRADLDDETFPDLLHPGSYDLVTAVEVIEHMERPIGFLRSVARLLAPTGRAVITTPNLDSVAARTKFLVRGQWRMMDEIGDPTHISPIFVDLLTRQYLPRSGLEIQQHRTYPEKGYRCTRARYAWAMKLIGTVIRGPAKEGDNHVLVLGQTAYRPRGWHEAAK